LTSTLLALTLLLVLAHLGGALFGRLRQPRVVGEIVGGALLGPTVLGAGLPFVETATAAPILEYAHDAGLVLLMFLSGARMHELLGASDRRAVAWLAAVGTALPFVATLTLSAAFPLEQIQGSAGSQLALALVLGIAASVTSIPVISRIFRDLGLLETRFARLVLGVAVVEDVALWAVLAIATALAANAGLDWERLAPYLAATVAYVILALAFAPRFVRGLERKPGNPLAQRLPLAWLGGVLLVYSLTAFASGVSLVFAAFFAGIAVEGTQPPVRQALERLERLSYAVPIPLYFAIVGFRLDFGPGFDLALVVVLVLGACAAKLVAVGLGALSAGFRGRDVLDLAVATNARGGPGIVLASVAYEAGIVNALGYTALVILAIVTSQAAGAWLERAIRSGRPLLGERVEPGE
jgi:Kef-type K+ transport system membrane component KefB